MPHSPSKSPKSPSSPSNSSNKRSNLNTDRRKTARSSALEGSASTAFNDQGFIIKDPSIVSIKNSRYPSGQTALFIHDAPSMKSPSKGPISGGFQIPMMSESTKAVKLSGINPSTLMPPSTGSTPSGSATPSTVPSSPTSGPTSLSGPSATPSGPQSPSAVTGKVTSPTDFPASSTAKPSELPAAQEEIKIPMSTGIKLEFGFAVAASLIFIGLWTFLMTTNCYNNLELVFWVKTFSLVGSITGLFVAIYCCFESNLSPRSGMTGCLFLTCLVVVVSLNLIGAYLTIAKCICKCDKNALKDGREDFWIAVLEVIGSALLIVVLIVASVSTTRV